MASSNRNRQRFERAIARVIATQGKAPILKLAKMLRDPQQATALADILEEAAKRPAKVGAKKHPAKTRRPGVAVMRNLKKSHPDKHSALEEFWHLLTKGEILKTMRDMRRFADEFGVSVGKASNRAAAIPPLLKSLSELSRQEIARAFEHCTDLDVNDDRSMLNLRQMLRERRRRRELGA